MSDRIAQIHPLAELLPQMTAKEFAALKADIAANGLRESIYTYEGAILDGRHRARACRELGVPVQQREFTGHDPRAFVISMNIHRRHLNQQQQRDVIEGFLRESPEKSDRAIAAMVGVHNTTVGNVRRALEATDQISQLPASVGSDGKLRSRHRENGAEVTGFGPLRGGSGLKAKAATEVRIKLIHRLFDEGGTVEQVAQSIGISRDGLTEYMRQHSIKVPDWSGRNKIGRKFDARRILSVTVHSLSGAAQGLQLLGTNPQIEREFARELLEEAQPALRQINAMMSILKESAK